MRVVLFAGKGGVGKTTLAAATGVSLSGTGRKTLVVSTDPAHSLGDVLDVRLSADPAEVTDGLFAAEVDTRALLGGGWSTLRTHLATLLAGSGVDEVVAEELTVLPGFEELLALSEVHRLTRGGPWETVVVDCAPTAESLRLLALREVCAGYLERLFPTHRRMVRGMLAGLAGAHSSAQRWDVVADALSSLAQSLESLRSLVSDQMVTSVRLVLTPERVVAAETRRSVTALALQGIRVDGLIANRLVPALAGRARGPAADWVRIRRREQGTEGCAGHARVAEELRAVVELLAKQLPPWLERAAQPGAAPGDGASSCPVCAFIAALRGDRPEVVGRLADHAAGLLAAVRELLTPPAEPAASRPPSRRIMVQHIEVRPVARDSDGAAGC